MLRGFGPASSPKPQYYNVACAEGHRLQGERVEGYQALRCPTCGEGIFVLPRSPLPDPPAPEPGERPKRARVRTPSPVADDAPIALADPPPGPSHPLSEEDEAELEWLDPFEEEQPPSPAADLSVEFDPELAMESVDRTAPTPAPPDAPGDGTAAAAPGAPKPRVKRPPGARPRIEHAHPLSAHPAEPAGRRDARPVVALAEPRTFGEWVYRHRHLLIFCGVALVVVGTISVRIRERRLRELPLVAEIGRTEGLPALDAGDFDTAHRKLGEARRAVERLGGAYEGADEIIQAAKEAAIYVDLIPSPLEQIMNEAARAENDASWQDTFKALYKGRSTILDGNVADYRILARSGPSGQRVGRIDTTDFALLKDVKPQPGESTFVFGARLGSITLEGGQWIVRLEPQSGVVMRHWKALEASRWPVSVRSDDESEGAP
jgi:hypothetical protein